MSLDHISDEELKLELARREDAKKKARYDEGVKQFELLAALMRKAPQETLALLAPAHAGRGNYCSDDNPHSNYFSGEYLECYRCFLISLQQDRLSDPLDITFYVKHLSET